MRSYLVETYMGRGSARERHVREQRARSAAAQLSDRHVSFQRSIYVPEDETCFFVFLAPTARDAALAAERAALEPIRVVEAISSRERRSSTGDGAGRRPQPTTGDRT